MEVVHCEEDTFEVRKAIKSDVAMVLPKMLVGCGNILYVFGHQTLRFTSGCHVNAVVQIMLLSLRKI
jgi:hypothetical protein